MHFYSGRPMHLLSGVDIWSMEDVVALVDAASAKVSGETLIG
jgi:hypothetical protein